jgi:hypothetical protein
VWYRLNDSAMYATRATLRFPVVQKIHNKPSVEVDTLQDLRDTQERQLQKSTTEERAAPRHTPRTTTVRMAKVSSFSVFCTYVQLRLFVKKRGQNKKTKRQMCAFLQPSLVWLGQKPTASITRVGSSPGIV